MKVSVYLLSLSLLLGCASSTATRPAPAVTPDLMLLRAEAGYSAHLDQYLQLCQEGSPACIIYASKLAELEFQLEALDVAMMAGQKPSAALASQAIPQILTDLETASQTVP